MDENNRENNTHGIWGYIIRLIVSMIVLSVTAFLTPGFAITGFWAVLLAAVIISAIDYAVEKFMGVDASPFGKGLKGFVISAIIIYLTQFLVPTMRVSIIGAIIAALVIGIIDAIIPGRFM
ncbi:phage holin family protein [Clostridium sp. FAM 1755]|uniref:Phage holin family protein n=1 Tax=Clostridium sporogenes TaxID=1509 RepID=A0AAE4JUE8_CLOSG|nr:MULTISPECIES: phage holin family protein [Clostridium]KOR23823.1 membrane protein [Clostridium sp. L74]MDS1002694.1 phage holin family protein [Clostridium sporogenes]NFN88743.1 phage holin family protein [Clostridium sporogenes]NFV12281.1 phage holin family protein [Clostridium sporogenes]